MYLAPFSGIYAVGFEQVNVGWVSKLFVDYCIYICLFHEKIANEKKDIIFLEEYLMSY